MKRNSLQIADLKAQLIKRNLDLLALAKQEVRELTEDEDKEFKENEDEIQNLDEEQKELDAELEKEDEKEEKNLNKNISRDETMEKKNFSLVEEIKRSINNGTPIQLNRDYTVTGQNGEGEDLVQTDVYNILSPLRAKLVLNQTGAHYIENAVGDIQLPIMNAGSASWVGETEDASNGAGTFEHVSLSPKRLSAFVEISDRLLYQDSVNAENEIRNDLIQAVAQKIESTVFGAAAGTAKMPAGLFNGKTPVTVTTYAELADMEAELEEDNFNGENKYVLSPKAWAAFRTMVKGNNNSGFVLENGEVDGTPALKTSNVASKKFLFGDWSQLYVAIWRNIELDVIRDTVSRKKGCITLVINMDVDVKLAREEALVAGEVE